MKRLDYGSLENWDLGFIWDLVLVICDFHEVIRIKVK
jgi:hypothetical protein